ASGNRHIEIVRLLLASLGVEISKADNHHHTALFFRSRYEYNNIVQALFPDRRINLGIKDWCYSTSLSAAVRNGHFEVVEVLLVAGGMIIEGQDGIGRSAPSSKKFPWVFIRASQVEIQACRTGLT
ncbi:hypothetical protein M441DRAFT_149011, partial [Trichoderma asperellum CBS 433.97]